MKALSIPFHSTAWEEIQPGVKQKRVVTDDHQIRLVEFDHSFIEKDWCIKGHIGYVVDGEMHIDYDSEILKYECGDAIYIPHGQRHKMSVVTQTVTLFLVEVVH